MAAAHQAWFFAATGRTEMAHAVAFDAMSLARKIPPIEKTREPATGRDVADEGIKLRAQIQRLLDSLGGSGGKRLKDSWYWVNNASTLAHEPPRGPKPYQVEPQSSATDSREPAFPVSPPISSSSSWV